MTTIAELMELAEIPVLEGYILPKLRPRKRKAASKAIGADLEDIEEEEGERKRLLDRIFKSDEDGSQPSEEPQPPLDPLQPIAGVNTAYAPRVVPPPTHLQMDEATRARVYGRKDVEPRQENALTVRCHRCEAPMRVCIRKLKYSDHIKEYPSFRCTRKGCQTFKSMRIVDEPALARVARIKRTPPKKKGGKKGQKPATDEDGDGEKTDEEEHTETTPGDVPNPYVGVRRKKKKNEAVATTPTSESSAPSAHLAPIPPPAMRSLGPVVSTGGPTGTTGTHGPAPTIPSLNHLMYPSMMTTRSHSRGAASLQQLLLPGRLSTPHRPAISFRLPPTPMSTSSSSKTRTSSETLFPTTLAPAQPRRRSRYDTCTQEQKEAVAALLRKYDEDLQREAVGGRRDYYSAFGGGGGWEEQRGAREAEEGPSRMEEGGGGREHTADLMTSSFESAKEASSPHLSAKSAAAIYEELVNAALAAAAAPKAPPPPVTTQPLVLPVSTQQQQSAPICITLSATSSPTPQLSHAAAAATDNVPATPTAPEEKDEKERQEEPAPLPPPPVMRTLRPVESPVPRSAAAYSAQQPQQHLLQQSMLQPLSPLDLRSFQLPRMQQHVLPLQQQLLQQVPTAAAAAPPVRALSPYETLALEQIASAARTLAAINVMTRTATTPPFGFGSPLVSAGYGGAQQSSTSSLQQQLQAQFAPTTMPGGGVQPMLQQQQLQYLQQLSPMLPAQWNFFGDEEQPRDSPTPYGGLHADTFDNASVMILEDDDSGIADRSNRDDTPSEQYDEYDSHEYDAEFAMELRQHNM